MLLTNFLPGGDGNFELHAIANAKDGGQKSLGTKTIYVDNAHAVKPFGAIDTPAQGGTASGNNFSNWGWVLTPQPNHIPTDGSTISVYLDGVFVGHPTYNIYRPDVAALFPGYANSSGSGGHFYLDTTAYENGVHSIFWTATDSGGNSDGIGSRFFIITGNNSYSYTLNVTKGAGVSGTPNSGTTSYTAGTTVNYSYSLLPGYTNLVVILDGNTVANSGTVTMNQNHTLTATATQSGVPTVEWIKIPAGEFKMGDNFNEGNSDERPVHTVYLSEYEISKYEVTFDQYDAFCDDTGRTKPNDKGWGRGSRPVIEVSWDDAKAFCDWMSSKTGQNIHLPTEAQWEKAARGTDQRRYPWGNSAPTSSLCNFNNNVGKTQPVGSYPSGVSPYGVHDMAGNVWEWCQDWYGYSYYSSSPYSNPTGPSSGTYRVPRGGGWLNEAGYCRVAIRNWNGPAAQLHYLGFRLARATQIVPSDPVVHLKSTPTGAKVYADSQEISSSTPADFTLSSGQHEIRLVLENYGKAKKTMNFEMGKTYNINVTLASYTYEFMLKWSRFGIGLEEFDVIEGIAVDKNGYVYVADYEYDKVHKFDSYGNLITQWFLKEPHAIAVDDYGYVYVSNDYSYIYKFNSLGGYITRWGGDGSGISIITGIAIDNVGYIYAADYDNKILVYTPNGEFVKQWGSQGNGNGQFENPYGIAIDTQNYVYVSDYYNHRIQKFTSNGGFVSQWGSLGSNSSQFSYPRGISIDRNNYIYVCDAGNHRIQKFTSDGSYVTKWGSAGSSDGQLGNSIGIAVDNNDYVYVTDDSNKRVQKFRISSTETDGDGDWQINTSPKASTTITSMYEIERQDNKIVQSSNKEEKKKTIME